LLVDETISADGTKSDDPLICGASLYILIIVFGDVSHSWEHLNLMMTDLRYLLSHQSMILPAPLNHSSGGPQVGSFQPNSVPG
jgi:hypothetical protein